jgi:PAS domain S-box-containing protein
MRKGPVISKAQKLPSAIAHANAERSLAAWRSTADVLPAMLFTLMPNGYVDYVNGRCAAFLGYANHEALARAAPRLVHPGDLARVARSWSDAAAGAHEFRAELRVARADGSYASVVVRAAPECDAFGVPVRYYGVLTDVERDRRSGPETIEDELIARKSERQFQGLAEGLPVICWTADATGSFDWYNHRWYEFTGQTPEEAVGWGWQAMHHPDDFLDVMRKWPHSIATGEPFEMEFRLRRRDGEYRWFIARAEPLRDDAGRVVRWYGSNVDIDEQKRAHERTKQIAETLQDVFLPKRLPQFADLRIDAVYLPAEKDALVGGDWFDAFELPDRRVAFSIGDVAGHGLEAAVMVGRLRQAIFTLTFLLNDPAAILVQLDRIVAHQDPDTMVTAIVGFIDPAHKCLTYANAGHPPPLIARKTDFGAQALPCGGVPLGLGRGMGYQLQTLHAESGSVVAMYTDGMVEFGRDLIAGEAKLAAAVALLAGNTTIGRPARAIQELVFNDAPARDDAALMILQFAPERPVALAFEPSLLTRTWRFHSSDAKAAQVCRREIAEYLRNLAENPDEMFAAELALGEILANLVQHAPSLSEISIDWVTENPVVTVRDSGPGLPALKFDLPDPAAEQGRGLYLISALTKGATLNTAVESGTQLRVTLNLRRRRIQCS